MSEFSKYQTPICEEIPAPSPLKKICPTCKPNENFIEPNWLLSKNPFLNEKNCEYEVTVTTDELGNVFTANALSQEPDLDSYLRRFVIPGIRLMLRYYNKLEINQLIYASIPGLSINGLTAEELLLAYPEFDSAFEALQVQNEPSGEGLGSTNFPTPEKEQVTDYSGDTYDVYRLDPSLITNPAITNPFALELYAYPKDFDIDPITGLGKVRVAIPAFIFDKVPEAPGTEDLQEEAQTLKDYVEIKISDMPTYAVEFSTTMGIYAGYQSFWYSLNRDSEIQYKDSGDPYYATDYATLSRKFWTDLGMLIFKNMPHTQLYKIKIEFDNSNPNNLYRITNVKGRLRGCKYQTFKRGGIGNFKQKYSTPRKTTLVGYIAKINQISLDLNARQSVPWLDFLVKYTVPVIHVNYGALSNQTMQKNGLGCAVDNLISEGEGLRDYILNETLSLSQILKYNYNSKNCAVLNDPTNQPEFEFNEELRKPYAQAKQAQVEAKKAVGQKYAVMIEDRKETITALQNKAESILSKYNESNREYSNLTDESQKEEVYAELISYNSEYRKTLEEIKILESEITSLESESRKKARTAGRRAAAKSLKASVVKLPQSSYQTSRIAAVEKFTSQETLLSSIIDLEQWASTGKAGFTAEAAAVADRKKWKEVVGRMSLCTVRSMSNKAIRCLLSGVTYEDAMRKLIRTALEAYDVDMIGIFVDGLPPEDQMKLRQQFEREFGDLPLPWEAGYDPGALSSQNPYTKYKSRVPTPEAKMVESADKAETKNQAINSVKAKIVDVQEEIYELKERVKLVEETILYTLQNIAELNTELDSSGISPETLSIITQKQAANAVIDQLKAEQDTFDDQFVALYSKEEQLNSELDNLMRNRDNVSAQEQARIDQYNSLTAAEQQATRDEMKQQSEDADSRSIVGGLVKGDPNDPTTPGTYGKSLANMQQAITQAYIRYVIDLLNIDVVLARLERLPGSEIIQRIIAETKCANQGLIYPPVSSFLSTLTLDPCGSNKGGLQLPKIQKLPTFFDSSFLEVVKTKFVTKLEDVLTQVLTGMIIKLLQVTDEALCKSINAVGQFVASSATGAGVSLGEAFNDAFCPDGTEEEQKRTRDNVFKSSGLNEISDNSFDSAFRSMSSVLSGKEAAALFSKPGRDLDDNVLNRIAAVINAFHPEFSDALGDPDGVRDIFTKTQKFIPNNVREELRRFADTAEDAPIYNNICLTKDEYDKWNRDREKLLIDKGLDESLAKEIIDKANDRALNDLEDVSAIIQQGPDGLLQDALDDLLGFAEDPSCSVNKSAITFEDDNQAALKKQLINDYFKILERDFLKDIIGDFTSVMQNVLRDQDNQILMFHEFYANFPIFFPNYVNNKAHWDLRKENAGFLVESFMEEDNIHGTFPETVGIHLRDEMDQRATFRSDHMKSGNFKFRFQDRKNGQSDDDFAYAFDLRFSYDKENPYQYRLWVTQKYQDSLENIENMETGIFEVEATDKIIQKEISSFSGSIERLSNYPRPSGVLNQAVLFKALLGENVSNLRMDNQLLTNVFDYQTTSLMKFIKTRVGTKPDGTPGNGYSFGYDVNQLITSKDLKYVNPGANPNDPDTWEYTYEEEDAVMGKSATENPRVHFLSPSVYGGSYKRPKLYIEPAVYNGWLSMIQTFVPEVEPCGDRDTNFLEIATIRERVKFVEDNVPMDERLSLAPECRDERPYDKLAAPTTHGLLEGTVIATLRVYATEFILRTLPIFSSVEYNTNNVDETIFDIMADEIEKGIKNETAWFTRIQGFTYWLLFLEQAVMAGQRQVKDGLIENTPELEAALTEIGKIEARYWANEPQAVLNGCAIAAYGEEFQVELEKPLVAAKFKLLLGLLQAGDAIGLPDNLMRYASKLYSIYKSQDAAKVVLRSMLSMEFKTLVDKVNFNMRPRPYIHDINKYILNKNGFVLNSNIRAGEQIIESPTVADTSVPAYGTVQNVVDDISQQNPLDGIELDLSIANLDLPGGVVEFLTADLSLDEIPTVEDIQSKLLSVYAPLYNGFFFLEKYVRTIEKDGTEQVHSVGQFQELIRTSGFDPQSHISDNFGNAQIVNDEMIGSIGVKYGVRLCYVMPKDAKYDAFMNLAKQERSYRFKPATASVRIPESVIAQLPEVIKSTIEPYTIFEMNNAFQDIVPVASFERDVIDQKIQDIDLQDQDMGEDIKCYVDLLVQEQDYQMIFEYIFPSRTFVSLLGTYSYFGFFQSIGESDEERNRDKFTMPGEDWWQDFVFNDSKKRLRKMFSSAYRSDDDTYDEEESEASRRNERRFLKNILPKMYLNLDSSINWFMRRHIVSEKPFDADGKPCKNFFQKLFED